jgi:hypothetical protein
MEHLLTSKIAPENFMEYKLISKMFTIGPFMRRIYVLVEFSDVYGYGSCVMSLHDGHFCPLEGLQEWSVL